MATVIIPSSLTRLANEQSLFNLGGSTIMEVLLSLCEKYPRLAKYIFDTNHNLSAFIKIYLNDHDVALLANEKTPVADTDSINIYLPLAGG